MIMQNIKTIKLHHEFVGECEERMGPSSLLIRKSIHDS